MTHVFSLLIGAGAALGLWQVARAAPPKETLRWVDAGLYALLGALAGARLGFVFLHFAYFRSHPLEALLPWLGGLSWPGAVLGGLLATALVAAARRLPFALVADHLAPLLAPLAITAWLGCWRAGCAYGPLLPESSRFAVLALAEDGALTPRLPLQLLAAFSLLATFAAVELKLEPFERRGQRAGLYCLLLSANLLGFSFLRADPAPRWAGLRPDAWAALLFTALALIAFAAAVWPSPAPASSAGP